MQIPLDNPVVDLWLRENEDDTQNGLTVYNKEKSVYITIAEKDEVYPILHKIIKKDVL